MTIGSLLAPSAPTTEAASEPIWTAPATRLDFTVNDIVFDPVRDVLYATVPTGVSQHSGRLVTIDVSSAEVVASATVGSQPDALAIAADASAIFVGVNGQGAVKKLTLPGLTEEWSETLGFRSTRVIFADDIEVQPGTSDVVAVSGYTPGLSPSFAGVFVIDDGTRLPVATPAHTGSNSIAFGTDPNTLYGSASNAFERLIIDDNGIAVAESVPLPAGDIVVHDDLVYGSGGRIIDPSQSPPTLLDTLGLGRSVAIDEVANTITYGFWDVPSHDDGDLVVYDIDRRTRISAWMVPELRGRLDRMVAVGDDRFAVIDLAHPADRDGALVLLDISGGGLGPGGALGALGEYTALPPTRFLDTRDGTGSSDGVTRIGPGETLDVQITGRAGIPVGGVQAVVVNVTAVGPSQRSFLSVFPTGIERPTIATLNMVPGENRANLATVPLGTAGRISVYNRFGSVDVVFDVAGYYSRAHGLRGSRYRPMTPVRIMDTRDGTGSIPRSRIGPFGAVTLKVAGRDDVPSSGVQAVVINVTVVAPTHNTFAVVYPSDDERPLAANVNARAGANVGNQVIVKLSDRGEIDFFNRAGSVDLVVDLVGYYNAPDAWGAPADPDAGRFVAVEPFRWLDTRIDSPLPGDGKLDDLSLIYSGEDGTASALVLNVTATQTEGSGNIRAFPFPGVQPLASTVNYGPDQTVPNHAIVPTGPAVGFQNNRGRAHLVVDMFGFFI